MFDNHYLSNICKIHRLAIPPTYPQSRSTVCQFLNDKHFSCISVHLFNYRFIHTCYTIFTQTSLSCSISIT